MSNGVVLRGGALCAGVATACAAVSSARALDGANAIDLTPSHGWSAFELVSQGDDLVGLADSVYGTTATRGKYDGLGARVVGDTLEVFLNHEFEPAAISRVDLDVAAFTQAVQSTIDGGTTAFPASVVTSMGFAYDRIFDGGYHAVSNAAPAASGGAAVHAYANTHFDRFCAGTAYIPLSFGGARGFADEMYITGEEIDNGRLYALDPASDTLWEVPDVGFAAWENAALVDTGNTTHVGLVLTADPLDTSQPEPIRLYVGEKDVDANGDGQIDFLERNGLRGGAVYTFDPDDGFSTTDLPGGQVTGVWSTSTADALLENKLEDVHTSPFDGTELVFADQNDGVYRMSLDFVFDGGAFDPTGSGVVIDQIDDAGVGPLTRPDNVLWAADDKLYVQEDGDGDQIFEMNPDGSGLLEIAAANSEPSGIIDVSQLLGYAPGGVLITSLMGTGQVGGQLGVLVSPDAVLILNELPVADYNGDGLVGQADLDLVLLNWGDTVLPAGFDEGAIPGGGPFDGAMSQNELDGVLLNWGAAASAAPGSVSAVPEPGTAALLGVAGFAWRRRRG